MHILLVDDHILFREGLKFLLSGFDESVVFLEAGSCNQVSRLKDKDCIDLVLFNLYIPGKNGLSALSTIKKIVNAPIVVLSSEESPKIIRDSIERGASGFIPKSSTQDVMIAALRLILVNGTYLPPHTLDGLSNTSHS